VTEKYLFGIFAHRRYLASDFDPWGSLPFIPSSSPKCLIAAQQLTKVSHCCSPKCLIAARQNVSLARKTLVSLSDTRVSTFDPRKNTYFSAYI
jgi:hypothetical protein